MPDFKRTAKNRVQTPEKTDEEFDAFMRDIVAVMDKYGEKSGGKERSISFISAPVEAETP